MTDPDFATRINGHRGYLLRVAVLQLRDADLAEDVSARSSAANVGDTVCMRLTDPYEV